MMGATGQPNYLLIGLMVGLLAGFLIGSAVMLQIGMQTVSAVRSMLYRRPNKSRVRFELLSQ